MDPLLRLEGKVALVTAGARGIGEGAARALAELGAAVAIADLDLAAGEATVSDIRSLGHRAVFIPMDACSTQQVRGAVQAAHRHFGQIDILVNNAGGVRGRAFLDSNEGNWEKLIALNLLSNFAATQETARLMVAEGVRGCIINVASSEAQRAAPHYAVYAACKAGLLNFTRSMALELAPHGIRVNAIAPDLIDTPGLGMDRWPPELVAARDRYIPLGRPGRPEEAASVIAFLASGLSSYVTGVTVPVDAGTIAASGWTRSAAGDWQLFHP